MKAWIGSVAAIGITAFGFLATGEAALSQDCKDLARQSLNGIPRTLLIEDPELCGHVPSGLGSTDGSSNGYDYFLERYDNRWVFLYLAPSASVTNPLFYAHLKFMDCSDGQGYEFTKRTSTSDFVQGSFHIGQRDRIAASESFWNSICRSAVDDN